MYHYFFKRIVDFTVALIGLILVFPVLLLLVLILFFFNNRHVFFLQERPGLKTKTFFVVKFKTMNEARDSEGKLLPDKNRLTKIGKFIRNTSLDELPQLWNVIKGDMSLIGPRPLLVKYLPLYNERQSRRHDVKPGITGWAQVNGRNTVSWEQKLKLDVWYVDNLSFLLDLKIGLFTIIKVFKREGINAEGTATTSPFKGGK